MLAHCRKPYINPYDIERSAQTVVELANTMSENNTSLSSRCLVIYCSYNCQVIFKIHIYLSSEKA